MKPKPKPAPAVVVVPREPNDPPYRAMRTKELRPIQAWNCTCKVLQAVPSEEKSMTIDGVTYDPLCAQVVSVQVQAVSWYEARDLGVLELRRVTKIPHLDRDDVDITQAT